MKCKYGDVWLTGTPWQEDCGEVAWSADQEVDVMAIIDAATPRITGRRNVADSVPVPISRTFSSAEEALQFCAELPWQLPAQGTLRLEEGGLVVVFPAAAFKNVKRQRQGLLVQVTYEFTVAGPPAINPEE